MGDFSEMNRVAEIRNLGRLQFLGIWSVPVIYPPLTNNCDLDYTFSLLSYTGTQKVSVVWGCKLLHQ